MAAWPDNLDLVFAKMCLVMREEEEIETVLTLETCFVLPATRCSNRARRKAEGEGRHRHKKRL